MITKDETTGRWDFDDKPSGVLYKEICERIKNGENFAFSRYGDGEWNAIYQDSGRPFNCDRHQYFPDMGKRLKAIIESKPDYMMGLQPLAVQQRPFLIELHPNWVNSDVLHNASIDEGLNTFYDAIKGKEIRLIAPEYLADIDLYFHWEEHILVPDVDCWMGYDRLLAVLKTMALDSNQIFLFCASMMTNVLIDDLYKLNRNNTYIDCGSIFDVYVGKQTRTYHKKLCIEASS